jgi:hypothetical protein
MREPGDMDWNEYFNPMLFRMAAPVEHKRLPEPTPRTLQLQEAMDAGYPNTWTKEGLRREIQSEE